MGIMIAGISSGSGKTTLTIGLLRALTNRGIDVAAFKAGPDYIDPMFHKKATGRAAFNLPAWMVDEASLKHLYAKRSEGHSLSIVEGVMGYFDGHHESSIIGSSAHLAELLGLDVVLVMDGSSMALTAAAVVEGLVNFHKPSRVSGVIFNRVRSEHHYGILKASVEARTGIKCYGYLKPDDSVILESRHLGLVQAEEDSALEAKMERMAKLVEDTVLVDALISDFRSAVDHGRNHLYDSKVSEIKRHVHDFGGLCLGVAMDAAFSFYYEENLALFKEVGINIKLFSPMVDSALPDGVEALYLGGGYPEVFADELEANTSMRASIKEAAQKGMPIYAECGGLMYLTDTIMTVDGKESKMIGLFSGSAHMTNKLQRFGHVHATFPNGLEIKGHEFHHSLIVDDDAEQIIRVKGNKGMWTCGHLKDNVLGTYVHTHFYSNLDFALYLINFFRWGSNAFISDGDSM